MYHNVDQMEETDAGDQTNGKNNKTTTQNYSNKNEYQDYANRNSKTESQNRRFKSPNDITAKYLGNCCSTIWCQQ